MSAERIRELLANHSILIHTVADDLLSSPPLLAPGHAATALLHRRGPGPLPAQLMREVQAHLPDFSLGLLADFERKDGQEGLLKVSDEFHIKILGPWNGAVRVTDEAACATPIGPERVWGYGYRTLEGHFERGQINFTTHKNLTTGTVQFRIHAVSQPGHIQNPFYWVGFRLFGRTLQRKFARESLRRMRELVAAALAGTPTEQTLSAPIG